MLEGAEVDLEENDPPMMSRFYVYAYRYASNANLIAVQLPEVWYYQHNEVQQRILSYNAPQVDSIVRSALGRAVAESLLGRNMDDSTMNWAQAPSITNEGFRQRIRPGFVFNLRGSLEGVGSAVRYNFGGLSVSTAYHTQLQGLEPIRVSVPFSGPWERGEVGVDSQGNLWLNYVGRF